LAIWRGDEYILNFCSLFDFSSGLSLAHATPRSIDASLGDRIWISTRDRVVEYDLLNSQWTVHDPLNDESHRIGETGDIPLATSRLEYTIHFQNVGTDTARNVAVSNSIDDNLDISTLLVLVSSHAYDLSFIEDGRILRWVFDNINLPDSVGSREESHGFVKYTIDLAREAIGTKFKNQAEIYFDFNPPVTTNETINTLMDINTSLAGDTVITKCDFTIHVSEGNLALYFPEEDKYDLQIFDMSGRQVYSSNLPSKEMEVNLGNLPSG